VPGYPGSDSFYEKGIISGVRIDIVGRDEVKKRIADMGTFLREQPSTITEFDEQLVRLLVEKVVVFEDRSKVEFRSGVTVDVDEEGKNTGCAAQWTPH